MCIYRAWQHASYSIYTWVEVTVLYITFTFRFSDNASVTTKLLNISYVDSVHCGKMSTVMNTFQRVMRDSFIELTSCSHGLVISHHVAAIVFLDWGKASACCFHICLSFAILYLMVSFQYSSGPSLHHLNGLPLHNYLL